MLEFIYGFFIFSFFIFIFLWPLQSFVKITCCKKQTNKQTLNIILNQLAQLQYLWHRSCNNIKIFLSNWQIYVQEKVHKLNNDVFQSAWLNHRFKSDKSLLNLQTVVPHKWAWSLSHFAHWLGFANFKLHKKLSKLLDIPQEPLHQY